MTALTMVRCGRWQPALRNWSLALLLAVCLAGIATPQAPGPDHPLPVASGNQEVLDINTASAADLKALPGIGDAYVKRIIEGRPYTAKNQLVTRGVLPQAAYERIRERIVAHRVAHSR